MLGPVNWKGAEGRFTAFIQARHKPLLFVHCSGGTSMHFHQLFRHQFTMYEHLPIHTILYRFCVVNIIRWLSESDVTLIVLVFCLLWTKRVPQTNKRELDFDFAYILCLKRLSEFQLNFTSKFYYVRCLANLIWLPFRRHMCPIH